MDHGSAWAGSSVNLAFSDTSLNAQGDRGGIRNVTTVASYLARGFRVMMRGIHHMEAGYTASKGGYSTPMVQGGRRGGMTDAGKGEGGRRLEPLSVPYSSTSAGQ